MEIIKMFKFNFKYVNTLVTWIGFQNSTEELLSRFGSLLDTNPVISLYIRQELIILFDVQGTKKF